MALTKLTIPPDQASYSTKDGNETLSVKLDGGQSRYRRDILEASSAVTVVWSATPGQFQYLRAFYKTVALRGALPFLIDLYLDLPTLTEHEVHFVPGSFGLTGQRGLQFTVSAQLEVKPLEVDDEYNETIVMLYNEYGSLEVAKATLDQLAQLVNVDMPGSLPG